MQSSFDCYFLYFMIDEDSSSQSRQNITNENKCNTFKGEGKFLECFIKEKFCLIFFCSTQILL